MQSNLYQTAIPLLADPDDIDPSSVLTDITDISQAMDLKLSKKGEKRVFSFSAAGGNHRTEALKQVVKNIEEKIVILKEKIEALEKSQKESYNNKDKLNDLKNEAKKLKAKKAGLGKWTVILYNESKWHFVDC